MAEKRGEKRIRRRLKLRYGLKDSTKIAFTEDISRQGFFIKTPVVQPSDTLLKVELTTPDNEMVVLEGKVQWTKRVPSKLIRTASKGGMGLKISKFISGQETYEKLCDTLGS